MLRSVFFFETCGLLNGRNPTVREGDSRSRTEFASSVKHRRQGELHIFTYGMDNGAEPLIHLRSEEAAVVIDSIEPNN